MNKHDVLTEHYSVIVAADILRGETLKHLPNVHQNQVPLETYIPLAREITVAILTECQRYHERMADQVLFIKTNSDTSHSDYVDNQTLTRTMELMKADLFHSMIKEITTNTNDTTDTTNIKENIND